MPPDLADYHRAGIGAESHVKPDIKIVYRLYQPYATDLKEVVGVLSPVCEPLDNAQHEPQIADDKLLTRLFIPRPDLFEQLHLLALLEHLELRRVNSADLDLIELQIITPL